MVDFCEEVSLKATIFGQGAWRSSSSRWKLVGATMTEMGHAQQAQHTRFCDDVDSAQVRCRGLTTGGSQS